jgi:archaellum component FlaF (FlaF/FlaG flagellin family)
LAVDSSVDGADLEVDGTFVGNTPSTVSIIPGQHTITVKKKGFADWSRTMNVSGNGVRLKAELETAP